MKRMLALGAGLALVAAAGAVGAPSVGAAVTTTPVVPLVQVLEGVGPDSVPANGFTTIWIVHGLNLDGQTAQSDGGTTVTVCIAGEAALTDFQFGDITPPIPAPTGATLPVTVHAGADAACDSPALITQSVTVPDIDAGALVATAGPGAEPALMAVALDLETLSGCNQDGSVDPALEPFDTRLGAIHAASAGEVSVTVDGDEPGDLLTFGEAVFADFPAGTYTLGVTLGGTPIVEADVTTASCTITNVFVVGNLSLGQPDPVVDPVVRPAFTG